MDALRIEHRGATVKTAVALDGKKLVGHAAVFNQETRIDGFREVIRRGAFTQSLSEERDILCLVDHNPERLLGRTSSNTLKLWEDEKGLAFEVLLPDTTQGQDILSLAKRGDLGGCSFGFTVPQDGEVWKGNLRELRNITLFEISVVNSWPAYQGTDVQARKRAFVPPKLKRLQEYLGTR